MPSHACFASYTCHPLIALILFYPYHSMISGFFEQSSHTQVKEFRYPDVKPGGFVPICEATGDHHNTTELTCHLSANFKPIELYFSLQLFVDRTPSPDAIADAALRNEIIDDIYYESDVHASLWQRVQKRLWSPPHISPYLPKLEQDFNVTIIMRGANSNVCTLHLLSTSFQRMTARSVTIHLGYITQ
jgi:hypothetical protein